MERGRSVYVSNYTVPCGISCVFSPATELSSLLQWVQCVAQGTEPNFLCSKDGSGL